MAQNPKAYKKVIAHLQRISAATRQSGGETVAKRALLDMYCAADPSIAAIKSEISPAIANWDELAVSCEWVIAPNSDANKRLLYIHGGSWMAGSPASHRSATSALAELSGCSVLAVAYRLAPESPFPAGLNDCTAAYRWLEANGPEGEAKATALFVAGDSAGGNLSLSLLQVLKQLGLAQPNAVAALSPATNLHQPYPSVQANKDIDPIINADLLPLVIANYLQGADASNPLVSPVLGELGELAPTLVQTGEREVLLDDSRYYAEKAAKQGGKVILELWPEMPHVFQGFSPFLPEATQALENIAEFFAEHS